MSKVKKFLWGAVAVGGLATGVAFMSPKDKDKDGDEKAKTEVVVADQDPYGNIALFERTRSKIKFALAFVENFYPFTYLDTGGHWTTGAGLTILYSADGKTWKSVTANTPALSLDESDVYKGRYMTYEVLADIKKCVKVPMDEDTLIAGCVLRYCIGGKNFKKSEFVKALNSGKTGAELARYLTGWRQQPGVLNRCYFFAAIMSGKMEYKDLLDLRAEGCYNLTLNEIVPCKKVGKKWVAIEENDGLCTWNFDDLDGKLEKAKANRAVKVKIKGGKYVTVHCKPVREIVPDYIWDEVYEQPQQAAHNNTAKKVLVYGGLGAAGAAALAYNRRRRKKYSR